MRLIIGREKYQKLDDCFRPNLRVWTRDRIFAMWVSPRTLCGELTRRPTLTKRRQSLLLNIKTIRCEIFLFNGSAVGVRKRERPKGEV